MLPLRSENKAPPEKLAEFNINMIFVNSILLFKMLNKAIAPPD